MPTNVILPEDNRHMAAKSDTIPTGCLFVFASIFAAVGVGALGSMGYDVVCSLSMRNWEETPAKIVDSKLESDSDGNTTYRAAAQYEYTYCGRQYTGDRVEIHGSGDSIGSFQQQAHRELSEHQKSGRPFRCYVNPANPSEAVLYRDLRWELLGFKSLFVVAFGGFGGGLMAALAITRRRARQKAAFGALHPDQPWLFRKDWADGRIKSSDKIAVLWPVAAALFWNAFPAFMWYHLWRAERIPPNERMVVYCAIAFTVVGIALMGWAVVAILRWWKYGQSVFEMASTPGVIGGQLAGVVRTSVKIDPEDGFHVKLSCVNCVTTQGSESRTSRNLVWQDEQILSHELLEQNADGSAIPVLFQIPYECLQTDDQTPDSTISWQLTVTARTPGPDYHATFEVPVFKTAESDPNFVADQSLIAKYTAPEDPERDLRDAGVLKTTTPTGDGWRFVFPMARTPGMAMVWMMVAVFCSAVPFVMFYIDLDHSPIGILFRVLFSVVFGLVGLLLFAIALDIWFYRSVVDVSQRGITVTGGLFGYGSSRWIDASEVAGINLTSRMGSGEGESRKSCFDIDVLCTGGKRITIGKRVPGKRLAMAVIRQIEEALL
jgi:hypothetical protein